MKSRGLNLGRYVSLGTFVLLELIVLFYFVPFFIPLGEGAIGEGFNVTTSLTVGASFPTILNVSIDEDAETVILTANDTTLVSCVARIVDFNGEEEISNVTGVFYDVSNASYMDLSDNNNHYTNSSCVINTTFDIWRGHEDDEYHFLATCTFEVEYYANPGSWNCSVLVTDRDGLQDRADDNIEISELLAIGIPDMIDYGTVNATYVSDEQLADVENLGNVALDLQLSAFANEPEDGLAMICTLGLNGTIELGHERYNLTSSTSGHLSLSEFQEVYKQVQPTDVLEEINLNYRFNDTESEAINPTYWRMYVPVGVAGTCAGKVEISAIKSGA